MARMYAVVCRDRGDQAATRRRLLIEHLRYMETIADRVVVAGPIRPTVAGDTREYVGSFLVYKVKSREEVDALFAGDPYAKAAIWESVEVLPFHPALGEAVGGITWSIVDGQVGPRTKPA